MVDQKKTKLTDLAENIKIDVFRRPKNKSEIENAEKPFFREAYVQIFKLGKWKWKMYFLKRTIAHSSRMGMLKVAASA